MKQFCFIILVIMPFFLFSQGETPPFSPDRPGQTLGASIVPQYHLQIETGYQYTLISDDIMYRKYMNQAGLLVRYGLLENLELRLGTFYNMYKAEDYFYDMLYEVNGTGPLSAGLKMPVYKGEKLVPSVSFLAELGLPYLANEDFRPDDFIPRMSVLFSNKLNDKISLGCNVGADWSDYARKTVGFYSLIIGYGFSDKLSVFAEGYGSFVVDEDADNRLDAGLSFLILPNFQIDAYGGIGLADMSDIYFIAGGLTYRIPE